MIPHQSVLSNVELALTISGVSKGERRKRAKEALEKVGLRKPTAQKAKPNVRWTDAKGCNSKSLSWKPRYTTCR